MKINFIEQKKPVGLPDAFILGEKFIGKNNVAMILGDNFFMVKIYQKNYTVVLILKKEQKLFYIK